jgi:hypothetical protein
MAKLKVAKSMFSQGDSRLFQSQVGAFRNKRERKTPEVAHSGVRSMTLTGRPAARAGVRHIICSHQWQSSLHPPCAVVKKRLSWPPSRARNVRFELPWWG